MSFRRSLLPYQRDVKILSFFTFLFGIRLYSAVAVIYFAHITHSYALAVSLLALTQLSQGLLEVPTGILSDRFGRVVCIRLGAVASIVSIICYGLAGSALVLGLGAAIEGLWRALISGNNEALLYEITAEGGRRAEFPNLLGRLNAAFEIAGFLAAILGGVIAIWSFRWLFWLSLGPQIMALIASFWLIEPVNRTVTRSISVFHHLKAALRLYRSNRTLRLVSLSQIIGGGIGESNFSLLPSFYGLFLPIWAVSWTISLNYIQSAIGFRMSGWFMRRFKPTAILLWTNLYAQVLAITAFALPSVASPALMAAAAAPYGPSTVASSTMLQQEFTSEQRATMASINSLLTNALYVLVAIATGYLADRIGVARTLLIAQIATLPTFLIYLRLHRRSE